MGHETTTSVLSPLIAEPGDQKDKFNRVRQVSDHGMRQDLGRFDNSKSFCFFRCELRRYDDPMKLSLRFSRLNKLVVVWFCRLMTWRWLLLRWRINGVVVWRHKLLRAWGPYLMVEWKDNGISFCDLLLDSYLFVHGLKVFICTCSVQFILTTWIPVYGNKLDLYIGR